MKYKCFFYEVSFKNIIPCRYNVYITISDVKKKSAVDLHVSCQINTDSSVMFERSVSTHATVTEVTTWKISCSLYGLYMDYIYTPGTC